MNYPVTTGFVWGRIGCRQAEAVFGSGMKVVACTGHEVVADESAGPYVRQTERWKRCLAVRRGCPAHLRRTVPPLPGPVPAKAVSNFRSLSESLFPAPPPLPLRRAYSHFLYLKNQIVRPEQSSISPMAKR